MRNWGSGRVTARLPGWALVGLLDTIGILALVMVQSVWVMALIVVAVIALTALAEHLTGWGDGQVDPWPAPQ